MTLDLRIPDERLALPKDIDLRPKHAKAWVESLPMRAFSEPPPTSLGSPPCS